MKKIRSSKCLLNGKISPSGPLASVEELYSLGNKCTLLQAALHTDMNLEIRFRTLTIITIKGVCALIQHKKNYSGKQSGKPNKPHIITVKVFCYFWNIWFRCFDSESTRERTNHSSQLRLVPKDPVKQLQDVPVPQAELREPAISVREAILANFKLLKIDFLELFCHGGGFHHFEVLLVTERSAKATFMSHINRSNVHWVWPYKRDTQILNGDSIWS